MSLPSSFGVITMAFGHQRYIRQAEALAFSLKRHMPDLKIALISDRKKPHRIFDDHVSINLEHGKDIIQKLWIDHYSPYNETLFIDSDCLVTRPFHAELESIRKFDFTLNRVEVLRPGDKYDFYFENLEETMRMVGATEYPKFNSGVYFFKKSPVAQKIFDEARQILRDFAKYKLKGFRGGISDENVMGLALAKLGINNFNDDKGSLMSTPIGRTGPMTIDVLGGGFSVMKKDGLLTPAICHFADPYAKYWPYFYNCFLARYPNSPKIIRLLAKTYYRLMRSHRLRGPKQPTVSHNLPGLSETETSVPMPIALNVDSVGLAANLD